MVVSMGTPVKEWLTIKTLEQVTGIPGTTLRRFADRFSPFLPGKTVDRVKKYPPESVPVFRRISELYRQGVQTGDVLHVLAKERPATLDVEPVKMETAAQAPPLAGPSGQDLAIFSKSVDRLASAMERLASAIEGFQLPQVTTTPPAGLKTPERGAMGLREATREETIARVLKLRDEGLGKARIANAMNGEGWPTLSGRGVWSTGAVGRILKGVR